MTATLYQQIQQFYDASSGLWEMIWGEHMHHGYYGADGKEKKDRRQAQIDLIEELLHWAEVGQGNVTEAVKRGHGDAESDQFVSSTTTSRYENILDVGCGIGGSTLYLIDKFNAKGTGITLSPVQAARASDRAAEMGLSARSHFQVADAQAMPFADNNFDLVWALESGEHMPDKLKFMQECYRVLKPGGSLIMVTWCHRSTDIAPLTLDEQKHLQDIYRVYCLPYVISLAEYAEIARQLPLKNIKIADWSQAVAPFWDVVIDSTFTPQAIFGLLFSGWGTIQAALSLGLMRRGYERGLIKFGLLCGNK